MSKYLEDLKQACKNIKAEKEKIKRNRKGLAVNYGNNVKRLRSAAGLTQVELADYVGLSRPMIIGIEKGTQLGSLDSFMMLCKVLDVQPNDLLELP